MKRVTRLPARRTRLPARRPKGDARGAAATAALACSLALAASARGDTESTVWAEATMSPDPIGPSGLDAVARAVLAKCGPGERGLRATAQWIVALKVRGQPMPELGVIAFAQRAAGEPHPWARAWAAKGRDLGDAAMRELDAWLAGDKATLRRCGVASGSAADGSRVLVVVSVDALADLAPLPTRVRVGQWVTVEARMRVAAAGGQVFILGPSGPPHPALTSFDRGWVRARFAPDVPGEFAVQVTADTASGPRPVIEASVFADAEPPASPRDAPAPGEVAPPAARGDDAALAAMVSGARAWAGLAPLARDPRLDELARDHAACMAARGVLAHDAGDGDPMARLHAAGITPRDAGENVAHATTIALAHRAMWASPSHRAAMLRRDFDRMGVAVARDANGDAWVVELFAADPGPPRF